MCDTMVALSNSTKDGTVIFAKNSDRQPNEPQIILRIPGKKHKPGEKVKCTYIDIDQAEETFEVLLIKPSWIWGCEMGCNEFGLNIGNEAVFTKEKYIDDSLIGMDMVRIALERCTTSDEALDMIISLLERYGQGGNCGYEKKFTYHNSFLIADKESAWVLETAGEYWAAEKVEDVRSISNCLTIKNKVDKCHPDLVKHAIDRGWCKSEKDFDFAKCYTNHLITKFSGAPERFASTSGTLINEKGNITVDTMKNLLRSHHESIKSTECTDDKQFSRHSLKSVCMHGGFLYGDHTTGSYIASLGKNTCTYWVTGSSTPCISIFKPLWLLDTNLDTNINADTGRFPFGEDNEEEAIKFWRRRELLHRYILENRFSNHELEFYLDERDKLENEFSSIVNTLNHDSIDHSHLAEIMNYALTREEDLISSMIDSGRDKPGKIIGNLYYKHYWNKMNKKASGFSDTKCNKVLRMH